jgi:putative effector of murein hydrolase LrgA (UPF0299 family)
MSGFHKFAFHLSEPFTGSEVHRTVFLPENLFVFVPALIDIVNEEHALEHSWWWYVRAAISIVLAIVSVLNAFKQNLI